MQPRGDIQLALGYWLVSHKEQLRKWWVIALLGLIGLAMVWTIIFFVLWYGQQHKAEALLEQTAAALATTSATAPATVEVADTTVITRSPTSVDVVGFLRNPNTDWGAARLTYHFQIGATSFESQETFLNPGSLRPVMRLNVPVTSGGQSATLTVDSVDWVRASTAALPTPNFVTEKSDLTSTSVTLNSQTFLTINLQATVTNRSVYNFLKVEVPIVVKNGDQIVAVEQQTLDRWPTLSSKSVTHTWPYPINQATSAIIAPQASQFDANNLSR